MHTSTRSVAGGAEFTRFQHSEFDKNSGRAEYGFRGLMNSNKWSVYSKAAHDFNPEPLRLSMANFLALVSITGVVFAAFTNNRAGESLKTCVPADKNSRNLRACPP